MLSVVATMEHRETCQCRPKQGPAMKSRATVDSSAAESTYKVILIKHILPKHSLGWKDCTPASTKVRSVFY